MNTFKLSGTVIETESGHPVPGLFIKAYDKDMIYDDLMGTATTNEDGYFSILSEVSDYRDFFEVNPDIYFKIYGSDQKRLIMDTKHCIRWNADDGVVFNLKADREKLGPDHPEGIGFILLGDDGAPRSEFEVGEPLNIGVAGLASQTAYTLRLSNNSGELLFEERRITDIEGTLPSASIWPQLGLDDPNSDEPITLDQAEERWAGQELRIQLLKNEKVLTEKSLSIPPVLTRPLLVGTDSDGIVRNGFVAGEAEAIVSGVRMPFTGTARLYLVPRQHNWQPGDRFRPVSLANGRPAFVDVNIDAESRRFRTTVAAADELAPGAYDFIIRRIRYGYEDDEDFVLRAADIVGYRQLTGLVIREEFMASKFVLGGCINKQEISGRTIPGRPYFRFTNVFPVGSDVYGALDPTAIDPGAQGKMVALYVVNHKTAAQWNASTALNHLPVLGGNPAVPKFKTQTGCINYNDRLLWPNATDIGEYDIVADFGNNSANAATFVTDASYDHPGPDMLDGASSVGFRVVNDPTTYTTFNHAGTFDYTDPAQTITDDDNSWDPYKDQTASTETQSVAITARVYFPADSAGQTQASQISTTQLSYPMFVFVHGNGHSYQGYNYLLEHMAKNGFIAAAIYIPGGMRGRGRAELCFKHIDRLNTTFGTKAANNIAIMGHSRGAEGVVIAALRNQSQALGHNINAVISLAPTDHYGRHTLGGTAAAPYLVIYGSMDGDVAGGTSTFGGNTIPAKTGFSLYDRANGAFKSMVFVYGSTHGRYTTVSPDTDITSWWTKLTTADHPTLLNQQAHQYIAKSYVLAFCRQHLLNEPEWAGMLQGEWVPPAVEVVDSGKVKLFVQHLDANAKIVDNFEGTHDANSWKFSTLGGNASQNVTDGGSLPTPPDEEKLVDVDSHSPHDTSGLHLRWDNQGDTLSFDIPSAHKDVSNYDAICFRITQKTVSGVNPVNADQDLYLKMTDTANLSRAIKVSKFTSIPPVHTRGNSQYTKSAMNTVRIPLHVWEIKVAGTQIVDLEELAELSFYFGVHSTGEVEIDSVAFTN